MPDSKPALSNEPSVGPASEPPAQTAHQLCSPRNILVLAASSLAIAFLQSTTISPNALPPASHTQPIPHCFRPAHWELSPPGLDPRTAHASFTLSTFYDSLFIDALNPSTHGSVRFVLADPSDPPPPGPPSVAVDITARVAARDEAAFRARARVCHTRPRWTEPGRMEGVVVSVDPAEGDDAAERAVPFAFDITVRLPAGPPRSPVVIPAFSASLWNYAFLVDDLRDRVSFGSLLLHAMNAPVRVESLSGASIRVTSWNGDITGSFEATSSIDLYAHNGAIAANASLARPARPAGAPPVVPRLSMASTDKPIAAHVSLLTAPGAGDGDDPCKHAYRASFAAWRAPLSVSFLAAPSDDLNLTVSASNAYAPSTIALPDSFTGTLYARSTHPHIPTVHHETESQLEMHGRTVSRGEYGEMHVVSGAVRRGDRACGEVDAQAVQGDVALYI
ncbi:uncharacterized protein C8Q71DRAFT_863749 [Rhodofomes roseus]|uniref:Uncharacterized protein n=1 Tax=Rhodofomes roseus TaxID=34475 RepID=A0ABQ8JXC3_9APHY|nr:uncharacterized protein C8Q71DRAFT_863749 [Rhodofomes roseus]KAH9828733.1 hypothetical protein C8Q71DRAFT_863749 [Rhodofomes roseus]